MNDLQASYQARNGKPFELPKKFSPFYAPKKKDNPEEREQRALIQWLDLKGWKYTAIPNSTYTSKSQANKNKLNGLRAGLPDMFIIGRKSNNEPFPAFIELKNPAIKPKKKGKGGVTEEQAEWIDAINQSGIPAFVAYGWVEAKEELERLSLK